MEGVLKKEQIFLNNFVIIYSWIYFQAIGDIVASSPNIYSTPFLLGSNHETKLFLTPSSAQIIGPNNRS